ncbi:MAG: flagellar motor switch protein FliG [Myxococcaceae bacterium]|nr:flagellar motor switch protein FliG [Myxococcaceae bacterium]
MAETAVTPPTPTSPAAADTTPRFLTGAGARKAAALLLGMGAEAASAVFRHLSESDVRQIALGAKDLKKVPASTVSDALRDYVEAMEKVGGDMPAGEEMLREIAAGVLGDDVSKRLFGGHAPASPGVDELLSTTAATEPEALAMVLAREQPQTVALVLSSLEPDRAVAVMEHLPEANKPQIVRRMAVVESVAPEVLREVRAALTSELNALVAEGMRKVDGRKAALEILRRASTAQQGQVLEWIGRDDPNLAAELKTKLFTFDDLSMLGDRDIQALLKETDTAQLTTALKGSTDEVKDKFLRNMSSRAAQMLADDLQAMGPVRLQVVEEAQGNICKVALELAEKGKLTIVRATDKMV